MFTSAASRLPAQVLFLRHPSQGPSWQINWQLVPVVQVDNHTKTQSGVQVVGYYQANEHNKDTQLSGAGKLLATKVATLWPSAIAVVVRGVLGLFIGLPGSARLPQNLLQSNDSSCMHQELISPLRLSARSLLLQLDPEGLRQLLQSSGGESPSDARPLFTLHIKDGRNWVEYGGRLKVHTAGIPSALEQLSAEGKHRQLADFEDHMEDVSLDWLNAGLIKAS